jgi:hypothetical protein
MALFSVGTAASGRRAAFASSALLAAALVLAFAAPVYSSRDGGNDGEVGDDKDGDGIDGAVDTDDDNDGISDSDELAAGTDPLDPNSEPGGSADSDHDGIKDDLDSDDDNDGFSDTDEVAMGTNPRNASSHPGDTGDFDGDGTPDAIDTDDDDDGVSDSMETEIGTDPRDKLSTPFGSTPAQGTQPLDVPNLAIKLDFVPRDSITLSGSVPVSGASLAGKQVVVNVGGVSLGFILNAQGSAKNGSSSVRFSKPNGGVSTYSIKLAKGNFTKPLRDEGLVDTDVSKTVEVSVSLLLDNVIYQVPVAQQYTGKKGKSGGTK